MSSQLVQSQRSLVRTRPPDFAAQSCEDQAPRQELSGVPFPELQCTQLKNGYRVAHTFHVYQTIK